MLGGCFVDCLDIFPTRHAICCRFLFSDVYVCLCVCIQMVYRPIIPFTFALDLFLLKQIVSGLGIETSHSKDDCCVTNDDSWVPLDQNYYFPLFSVSIIFFQNLWMLSLLVVHTYPTDPSRRRILADSYQLQHTHKLSLGDAS
ncbi:hypothetical protein DM02DRAFT_304130 [Periconia macrospinosa]|uniref:Uncharacterized protein n=1 Tax=Periconia macrospinosa TaxID=97972 RepID=A0A2V1DYT9_9PLEO|nr:hypothetical protein DM02DRAFT_304130 [Periconia macrospinosa]